MSAEAMRLAAAQAKADEVAATVGETPDGGQLILVSFTFAETGQRLATCFLNYETTPALRLVAP